MALLVVPAGEIGVALQRARPTKFQLVGGLFYNGEINSINPATGD